jgi:hypothetical protein
MELTEKMKSMLDPKDKAELGERALTYDEIEERAGARVEKELHDQYWAFLMRNGFNPKLIIHAPMHKRSALPVGFPDFMVMRDNKTLLIEFKVGKNTTSFEQNDVLNALAENKFTSLVLHTLEAAQRETKTFFNL